MEEGGIQAASFAVSKSLESRDNPFLPGGELSKEAEELLKNATIVRDKFYLDHEGRVLPRAPQDHHARQQQQQQQAHNNSRGQDNPDGSLLSTSNNNNACAAVLEERISPVAAAKAESGVGTSGAPRENGKAGDGLATSPDGVRLDLGGGGGGSSSPTADGSKGVGGSDSATAAGSEQQDKDKAKRRPKCCVLM